MAAFCFVAIKTHTATSMAKYIILDNINLCSQDSHSYLSQTLTQTERFTLNNLLISHKKVQC